MLVTALSVLIVLSLGAIAWMGYVMARPRHDLGGEMVGTETILLGCWLVAVVFFGPNFLALRPAGIFDITIERALFIALLLMLTRSLLRGQVHFSRSLTVEWLMLLFLLLCFLSMVQFGFGTASPGYPSPWFTFLSGYLFPFIVFVYAKWHVVGQRAVRCIFYFVFLAGLYLVLVSPLEFFQLRQYVFPQYINDPTILLHLDRARGPFQNAGLNGLAILFGFLCGVYLTDHKQGIDRGVHIGLLALFFPAIFFTQTRSVYLGFLVVLLGLLFFYRTSFPKWKAFFLPLSLAFLLAAINSPRLAFEERSKGGVMQVDEVKIRFTLMERSIAMIGDQPFRGVGLAQFIPASVQRYKGRYPIPESTTEQTQHNHLLGLAAELGIVGMLIYVGIVGNILVRGSYLIARLRPRNPTLANLPLVLILLMISYLLSAMFLEPSYFLASNATFFTFAGILDGLYDRMMSNGQVDLAEVEGCAISGRPGSARV